MKVDVREKLINTTAILLQRGKAPESITARDIVTAADVNLAMINYYFKSKDELVYLAIGELMREEAGAWFTIKGRDISAYNRLRQMLISLCDITVKYSAFTRISVEYEILNADISVPQYILPLLREICGNERSELSIRITAYEIISLLQLLFLRAKDFWNYAGVDVLEHDGCVQIIDTLLSSHFPKEAQNESI